MTPLAGQDRRRNSPPPLPKIGVDNLPVGISTSGTLWDDFGKQGALENHGAGPWAEDRRSPLLHGTEVRLLQVVVGEGGGNPRPGHGAVRI